MGSVFGLWLGVLWRNRNVFGGFDCYIFLNYLGDVDLF